MLRARDLLLALGAATAASADPCECLNWKQVYESERILCGEGWEFAFDYPFGPEKTYEFARFAPFTMGFTYHEFCGSFFKRMDNNYCVNIQHHTYDSVGPVTHQWCYVSKECKDLNGGTVVQDKTGVPELPAWLLSPATYSIAKSLYFWPKIHKRDLAMKHCTSGKDTLLGEMPVPKVVELAQKMDSVVGFVTKTAYPMARRNDATTPHWAEMEDAVKKGEIEKLPPIVQQAIKDKKPIVVDVDPEGHTHQRIIVGKEVWDLDHACNQNGCGGKEWPFKKGRDQTVGRAASPTRLAACQS